MRTRILSLLVISLLTVHCGKKVDVAKIINNTKQIYLNNKVKFFIALDEVYKKYPQFKKLKQNIQHIYFSDFDHTLASTETRIPVKRANGTNDTTDPKCMVIQKGDKADFSIFKEKALFNTKPIPVAIERLKQARKSMNNYIMVLTARSQQHTFTSVQKYLRKYNLPVDYVIAVNSKLLQKLIWKNLELPKGMLKLPKGMKKPLLMRAFVEYARSKGVINLQKITYMEDTDKYISSYMSYMPTAINDVQARVFDYVRSGTVNQRSFTEVNLGTSRNGLFYTPKGKIKQSTWGYHSDDCKK